MRGSAIVEFVLVVPILLLVAVAIVQLVLLLTVRSTLESAAVEGARAAALAGSSPDPASRRVHALLNGTVAESAVTSVGSRRVALADGRAIETRIDYRLTLLGLLLPTQLTVTGHVLVEEPG